MRYAVLRRREQSVGAERFLLCGWGRSLCVAMGSERGLQEEMSPDRSSAVARLASHVLLLLAVAGCAGGAPSSGRVAEPADTTARPTANATTTTTHPDLAEAELRAAYEASSRAFIDAAAIPDPNLPALADTHTGPMLKQRRSVLLGLQAEGHIIRYPPESQYRIAVKEVDVEDGVARLLVCVVDDGETVIARTGEVVAGGLGTVQLQAAMVRERGTWKLAEREQQGEWEGVAGCATA